MAWRLLAVLLVLAGTAWSAPIVIRCYDGSSSALVRWSSQNTARVGVCDLDRALDGRCQFRVSLGATGRKRPRVFAMTLQAGRRKHVQYADTTAVLKCLAGPEPLPKPPPVEPPPGAVTYTCQDGVLVESATDPVCDVDQACDDTCTFGFHCPTCCGCLAPCFLSEPAYRIPVLVAERYVLPASERGRHP